MIREGVRIRTTISVVQDPPFAASLIQLLISEVMVLLGLVSTDFTADYGLKGAPGTDGGGGLKLLWNTRSAPDPVGL